MVIAIFIGPVILAVLGAVVRFGKASFLIAGYNTATKEEKEKYDEEALCKFVGNFLFVLAGMLLLIGIGGVYRITFIVSYGGIIFAAVAIAVVIYMNTGNRFKK